MMLSANIWNMKTHKKKIDFFFFQFGHSETKIIPRLTGLMSGSPCSFTCQTAVLRNLFKKKYIYSRNCHQTNRSKRYKKGINNQENTKRRHTWIEKLEED